MRVEKDFVEFLGLFNKNKIKYCIIGAFAVGYWGYPRYTKDIDILVEPTLKNAQKIINALREFGIISQDLTEKDFSQENKVIQLENEPVRIDILTSLEGFKFEEIWQTKQAGSYGNQKVYFMGQDVLIKSKKKANRLSDRVDLEKLLRRRT